MTDKFEAFIKRNAPEANGPLKALELPSRKNHVLGFALSGLVAASLAIVAVNQTPEEFYTEDLIVSFEDELPEELDGFDDL